MRRRILIAIAAVAAGAVVLYGIPLAISVSRLYRDDEVIRLEREATRAGQEVDSSIGGADPVELPRGQDGTRFALYAPDGRRVAGDGPVRADAVVRRALGGSVADSAPGGDVAVAVPVARAERVIGAIRAERSRSDLLARTRRAWVLMAALGIGVIGAAATVALALSRRLARPIEELSRAAERLGAGNFTAGPPPSGVPEIDAAGGALALTGRRIGGLLERERAFSANASHQLRTPLAALRLDLEVASLERDAGADRSLATRALEQVERLEQTIDALLVLARDVPGSSERVTFGRLLAEVEDEWHGRLADRDRPLRIRADDSCSGELAAAAPTREILRVLLENALTHGSGAVSVSVRRIGSAVALDVRDEGRGISEPTRLFARRDASSAGVGIGLALARSLAEAEGGRLSYDSMAATTTFTLLLPRDPTSQPDSNR